MKRILPFLFILFTVCEGFAQLTSCAQTLRLARSTYEQGRLHEIPTLLEKCIASGFSQRERVEAYKLLSLSYIYLEEPEKADAAMLNLLRTDHYFEINKDADPAEFIALYKTFRTHPIYRIGAKLGANASQPNVKSYLPSNDTKGKYAMGLSFQGGFTGEIPITKKLTLSPEVIFQLKNFNYESTKTIIDLGTGEELDFTTISKENQSWLSVPISVQYYPLTSKFNPFVSLGLSADYLLSAKNTFQRTKEDRTSYDEQTENILLQRNQFNLSALASIGAKVKVPNGFAVAEVRFSYGLTQVTNDENLYALSGKTIPTDGYVDGLFSMNTVSFTLGYVYNVFNPKKLKR